MDLDLGLIVICDLDTETYKYKQSNRVFAAICVLCRSYLIKSRDAFLTPASHFFGHCSSYRRYHTIQTLYTAVSLLKPKMIQASSGKMSSLFC